MEGGQQNLHPVQSECHLEAERITAITTGPVDQKESELSIVCECFVVHVSYRSDLISSMQVKENGDIALTGAYVDLHGPSSEASPETLHKVLIIIDNVLAIGGQLVM